VPDSNSIGRYWPSATGGAGGSMGICPSCTGIECDCYWVDYFECSFSSQGTYYSTMDNAPITPSLDKNTVCSGWGDGTPF
jgi:hypothetical protein